MKHLILFPLFLLLLSNYATSQTSLNMNIVQLKPETLSTSKLLRMQPDSTIVSFMVSVVYNRTLIETPIQGNSIPDSVKVIIQTLKPGDMVFYGQIIAIQKGILVKLPAREYVIR